MTQPEPRDELAAALRALRLDAGLSTTELAHLIGWSQSKVSRIERGVTLAKPAEVDKWIGAFHTDHSRRHYLMDLAEQQFVQFIEWKRTMAPGYRRLQEEFKELEESSSVIRSFGMNLIPGLAQTAAYAEVMFRLDKDFTDIDNIAEVVQARLARQVVLKDTSKKFKLLCGETALRRSLLPTVDMKSQIDRIIDVARLPNVEFGVIPFSAHERFHTHIAYAVLGDPDIDMNALVSVETLTRGLRIRSDKEVRSYIDHYSDLATEALYGDDLTKFLRELSTEAPWS